ncbi:integral membrane protein GPR137B-like isoform X3 [Orbicella faveolata]|uniref:integral membrane protein GPR137B-like isoform X3 n=1 Tax=Orbicella faveolata TaxID=48498 RepID=UPI0009E36F58|nr:integral membrane protein GPR137B-like isoform X3 [Orbicella faveolata]
MMEESEMNFIVTPSTAFHDHASVGPTNYDKSIRSYTINFTTPADILPPISHLAQLVLASVFTVLYAVLFLLILVQLYLILYFKHRRLSYQSVFLFIYLFWAALRTTLFSFYFNDTSPLQAKNQKNIGSLARWLLFALPICLQFLTLSLLTLYLAKVVLKTRRISFDPITFRKYVVGSFAMVNIVFFAINMTSSFVCPEQDAHEKLVILRVVVNGLLFVVVGIVLCFCIIKITRAPSPTVLLEGQGATTKQGIVLCVLVVLLYVSRVIYNLIAVTVPHDLSSFGYGWINVSDEGEIKYKESADKKSLHSDIRDVEFITFGIVLIVWEVLPTFMFVWFFRVRRPNVGDMGPSAIASQSYDKKSYFFDNPRRYDSDEDLTNPQGQTRGSNYNIPGVLSPSASSVNVNKSRSYGSISGMRSGSFQRSNSYSNIYIPGTTPPQLSAGSGYRPNTLVEQNEG